MSDKDKSALEQLERRTVMPVGEWYKNLVMELADDFYAAKKNLEAALAEADPEQGSVLMGLACIESLQSTRNINSDTRPELMEQVIIELMDSIQNPTDKNMVAAEILNNLHSVTFMGLAPRFTTNVATGISSLHLLEPTFDVYTKEPGYEQPLVAFRFTVGGSTGFQFNIADSIPAVNAKARVQTQVARLLDEIAPTTNEAATPIAKKAKKTAATKSPTVASTRKKTANKA